MIDLLDRVSRRAVLGCGLGLSAFAVDPARAHKKKHKTRARRRMKTNLFAGTSAQLIAIPEVGTVGPAAAYPSSILVSGFKNGVITHIQVRLWGISHNSPTDIDVMLTATHLPGLTATIMSDTCGGPYPGVTVRNPLLDDDAPTALPLEGQIPGGTFKPTNYTDTGSDLFPAPAPTQSGNSALAVFNGQDPNGTWQLWIADDNRDYVGSYGGWAITITAKVDA